MGPAQAAGKIQAPRKALVVAIPGTVSEGQNFTIVDKPRDRACSKSLKIFMS